MWRYVHHDDCILIRSEKLGNFSRKIMTWLVDCDSGRSPALAELRFNTRWRHATTPGPHGPITTETAGG